jgi:5-methylcytosine-specific restriction endonuclease McrA
MNMRVPYYEPVMAGFREVLEKTPPVLRRFRTAKEAVIYYYGGCCAECGFADLRALELHHINYDGKENRVSYGQIVKKGYPDGLQLLCANCHKIAHSEY